MWLMLPKDTTRGHVNTDENLWHWTLWFEYELWLVWEGDIECVYSGGKGECSVGDLGADGVCLSLSVDPCTYSVSMYVCVCVCVCVSVGLCVWMVKSSIVILTRTHTHTHTPGGRTSGLDQKHFWLEWVSFDGCCWPRHMQPHHSKNIITAVHCLFPINTSSVSSGADYQD